jgi:hypothetical protein
LWIAHQTAVRIDDGKPSAEAEMKAFLASKAVDQISDYSQRDRSYRALSDE